MSSEIRQAAIELARTVAPVLPVAPGKGPLCAHGVYGATRDESVIARWPDDAQVALVCDPFWVLDVDPRRGGDRVLSGWLSIHGQLPTTWHTRTGGGGDHFYFAHEPELEDVALGAIASGIDVKGNAKHYVIAPPSRSKSGPYRWVRAPHSVPLARAPRWLIDTILAVKRPKQYVASAVDHDVSDSMRVERARRYARACPAAISGSGGHDTTFRIAMMIGRGFDLGEYETYSILASEWNYRCSPPWSERDLRRKVSEALTKGSLPRGALLTAPRAA